MHKLHPGARWLFRLGGFFTAFILAWILGWFLTPLLIVLGKAIFGADAFAIVGIIILCAVFYIVLVIIIAEIYARMAYNRWRYEFTHDNLRLERGIIWKRYSNVPYERVQNVDIHRGIIARICGFSSVHIQTAGFAYAGRRGRWSEGYIPAVTPKHAEEIREFLMKKISKQGRRQGL